MQKFFFFGLNLVAVIFLLSKLPAFAQPDEQAFIVEGYPDTIQARLEAREKLFLSPSTALSEKSTFTSQYIIDIAASGWRAKHCVLRFPAATRLCEKRSRTLRKSGAGIAI